MNSSNWKIGVSTCFEDGLIEKEIFESYTKNNIDMMEISMPEQCYSNIKWSEVKKHLQNTNVEIWSFHLPFSHINNISAKNLDIRKKTIKSHIEYIKRAAELNTKIFVVHPSAEPNEDNEREELIKLTQDSLSLLANEAEKYGSVIAVENLPRTCLGNCSDEIGRILAVDNRLKACFDTNHLLIQKSSEFIKNIGDKIVTVHISDYDFLNERHWLPYEGSIDWIELVTNLEEIGYNGPFMYEVHRNTPPSIIRGRKLDYSDLYNNYLKCINKEKDNSFGTPNKEECLRNSYFKQRII